MVLNNIVCTIAAAIVWHPIQWQVYTFYSKFKHIICFISYIMSGLTLTYYCILRLWKERQFDSAQLCTWTQVSFSLPVFYINKLVKPFHIDNLTVTITLIYCKILCKKPYNYNRHVFLPMKHTAKPVLVANLHKVAIKNQPLQEKVVLLYHSTVATILFSLGWSLYTGLSVIELQLFNFYYKL